LHLPVSLNIYNQCKDIHLTCPIYFNRNGRWHVLPDQEIGLNTVMKNRIEFESGQDILEGALVYRIQRQHANFAKSAQGESRCIQLLVVWRIEHVKGLHVHALLVEYDSEFNWDEDKLRKLYQKYWHLLDARVDPMRSNWLLDNGKVLATTIKVMNGGYRWDVFIAKGIKAHLEMPLLLDAKR
jgi:hypothetical protein